MTALFAGLLLLGLSAQAPGWIVALAAAILGGLLALFTGRLGRGLTHGT